MADIKDKSASELREEIIGLGPWHHDVQVTPEISTRVFLEAPEGTYPSSGPKDPSRISLLNSRQNFVETMERIYPEGLGGRSFLECACNCGSYCFWAKELGAGRCFGFDVRDHWIDQARFLQQNRTVGPTDGMRFEVMDLYDLPKAGLEPFDVTLFKGIFYHLPDPITGLKAAADLTNELLILDTAIKTDLPDGMLAIAREGKEPVMTGVYGLNWFPTGAGVLAKILRWMGFAEVRLAFRRTKGENQRQGFGRMRVIASRTEGLLGGFELVDKPGDFAVVTGDEIVKAREIPSRRPS